MSSLPNVMPRLEGGGAPRIDRLDWAAGTCFETFGVRVGVRSNQPGLLERLPSHLPPSWEPGDSPVVDELFSLWIDPTGEAPPRASRLYAGGARRHRTQDLDELFVVLESEIRQRVAAASTEHVFVHAGVVGWKGRAILIPGRSRSGKTTLTAELVKAGATYYSDEFAVLDDTGRVHPFSKPLSVRGAGGCDCHARRQTAEELGGVSGSEPLSVALVALTEYREGAQWEPRLLSAGRAVLEMLKHTVPARLRPEESLLALGRAVGDAAVLAGERGEAPALAARLLAQIEDSDQSSFRLRTGQRGM